VYVVPRTRPGAAALLVSVLLAAADNPDAHWNGIGAAALTIELPVPRAIHALQVSCRWGDGRAYKYRIEASPDGGAWQPLVDMSENAKPSGAEGYAHEFQPVTVKSLRIHVLGNTVNDHGHLCELRAF
jgi:hypothetical protein